jgi:hypothetical protein
MPSLPVRWDRASAIVARNGLRAPEIPQLEADPPDVATLFTFMRDAELRWERLRLRIEERIRAAENEVLRVHEVLVRHPGLARVTVTRPDLPTPVNHEVWLSDGTTVRTYRAGYRLAATRPVRSALLRLDDAELPGTARPYVPLTALPPNSLADTFIHPGGFAQNVLATGACAVVGTGEVAGRRVVLVRSDRPRSIEVEGDRPDHRFEIAVDRETGVLALLVESFGSAVTRRAEAVELAPNAPLPDAAFDVAVPEDAAEIY